MKQFIALIVFGLFGFRKALCAVLNRKVFGRFYHSLAALGRGYFFRVKRLMNGFFYLFVSHFYLETPFLSIHKQKAAQERGR